MSLETIAPLSDDPLVMLSAVHELAMTACP
jgi:hypothetical protein